MLDLSYWTMPLAAKAFWSVKSAIRSLQELLQPMTFAQAQINNQLAERLLEFWTSLEDAEKEFGESEPRKLTDTIWELRDERMESKAFWAGSLLLCGGLTADDSSHQARIEKIQKSVRSLFEGFRAGEEDEMMHHIKKRFMEYELALLTALDPNGTNDKYRSELPRWDGTSLWYGGVKVRCYQKKAAPEQAIILAAMEKAGWPSTAVSLPNCETLNITLNRINKKIKDQIIRLHAGGDGKSVLWFCGDEV